MLDHARFEAHLAARSDLRDTTRRSYAGRARTLARAAAAGAEPTKPYPALDGAARALLAFGEIEPQLRAHIERYLAQPRARGAQPRKHEARSIADADWPRLVAAVEADGALAARALEVIFATGLRSADTLRIEYAALRRARERGAPIELEAKGGRQRLLSWDGAPAWERLYDAWTRERPSGNLASLICPSDSTDPENGGCAYTVLRRALKRIAATTGLDERVYLHRLRRTVVVQALRVTDGDIVAVAELVGHKSIQTTASYADEANPERSGALQRKIAQRFTKGDPT